MVQLTTACYVCNRYHNRSNVSGMIEQLGWATLEERRAKYLLCMFYKVVNGLVAIPAGAYLQEAKPLPSHNHLATYTPKTSQNPVLPVELLPQNHSWVESFARSHSHGTQPWHLQGPLAPYTTMVSVAAL